MGIGGAARIVARAITNAASNGRSTSSSGYSVVAGPSNNIRPISKCNRLYAVGSLSIHIYLQAAVISAAEEVGARRGRASCTTIAAQQPRRGKRGWPPLCTVELQYLAACGSIAGNSSPLQTCNRQTRIRAADIAAAGS